jgi:hypothetical protein
VTAIGHSPPVLRLGVVSRTDEIRAHDCRARYLPGVGRPDARHGPPRSDDYTWPTSSNVLAWAQDNQPTAGPPRAYYVDGDDSRLAPEPYRAQGVPWFRQSVTYLAAAAAVTILAGGSIAYSLTSNSHDTVPLTPNTVAPLAPAQSLPPPAPVPAPATPVAPPVQIPAPAPAAGGGRAPIDGWFLAFCPDGLGEQPPAQGGETPSGLEERQPSTGGGGTDPAPRRSGTG